jgi:hypothetical protein
MTDRTDALSIAHAGLDEAGSLTADTPFFTMAVVLVAAPDSLRNLIKRAALRSGKRLRRTAKAASEIKWSNASQRLRSQLLDDLTGIDVEVFALTVLKAGRRIEDAPANYGILACELMSLCWPTYPNIALSLDRHFTSPAQVATVNTLIHRHWPKRGVLSIALSALFVGTVQTSYRTSCLMYW